MVESHRGLPPSAVIRHLDVACSQLAINNFSSSCPARSPYIPGWSTLPLQNVDRIKHSKYTCRGLLFEAIEGFCQLSNGYVVVGNRDSTGLAMICWAERVFKTKVCYANDRNIESHGCESNVWPSCLLSSSYLAGYVQPTIELCRQLSTVAEELSLYLLLRIFKTFVASTKLKRDDFGHRMEVTEIQSYK